MVSQILFSRILLAFSIKINGYFGIFLYSLILKQKFVVKPSDEQINGILEEKRIKHVSWTRIFIKSEMRLQNGLGPNVQITHCCRIYGSVDAANALSQRFLSLAT